MADKKSFLKGDGSHHTLLLLRGCRDAAPVCPLCLVFCEVSREFCCPKNAFVRSVVTPPGATTDN